MAVKTQDISVVVQGAVNRSLTPKCLESIREFLPGAQVILSTWLSSDIEGLDYDDVVLDDPGGIKHDYAIYNVPYSINNFNRQLLSTRAGIGKVNRRYILKLRTDLVLRSSSFLAYWDMFSCRDERYKIFHHRVLCSCLYSREHSCQGGTGYPIPFHPSDFWFFGEAEDIADYFECCPFQTEEESGNWDFRYPNRVPYHTPLFRYAPEQRFCYYWIKKYYPGVSFEDWSDWGKENIALSTHVLYNNFIFLGYEQSGIYSEKHAFAESMKGSIQGLITYQRFEEGYVVYCDETYQPEGNATRKKDYKLRLKVHCQRLIYPLKRFMSWAGEFLSVLFYAGALFLSCFKKEQE